MKNSRFVIRVPKFSSTLSPELVMLKTSDMSTHKNDPKRNKNKEVVINNLRDLFGPVFHMDIIRSVATECNFDIQRSSNMLLEMTNSIHEVPKKSNRKKKSPQSTPTKKVEPRVVKSRRTLELEGAVNKIRQGYKVLVILRGLPGSGKSQLARAITDVTLGPGNNSDHVLSTDDFFMGYSGYCFDPTKLQEAHEWNHRRAFQAMSRGLSPVVIDNTNTQMWEMKPYAMMATDYGYFVEILEPDTWWAFNDKELAKRNTHGVPKTKIRDMLDRYDKNITGQNLLSSYNLVYRFQTPPQLRLLPPIVHNGFVGMRLQPPNGLIKSKSTPCVEKSECEMINLMDFGETPRRNEYSETYNAHNTQYMNLVDEILMCNEEDGVDVLQPDLVDAPSMKNDLFNIENAWGVDERALQSWDIVSPVEVDFVVNTTSASGQEETKPETREFGTLVEPQDYNVKVEVTSEQEPGVKILKTQSRDINVGLPSRTSSPPKKIMVDQSCITEIDEDADQESRIKDLMDLFPKAPKSSLQELYDKCNKNFHWTVDLLLDDANLEVVQAKDEEKEESNQEDEEDPYEEEPGPGALEEPELTKDSKIFKKKNISENSLELKKCLESKFDINRNHYSDHVYKVKQTKFGIYPDLSQPSTSSALVATDSDSSSEDEDSGDNPKDMVELNLGDTFVDQLETMFGGDAFPKGFQPVVQMPISLARQIYSFYVESLCQQMEAQNHILDHLVKEDEDFARKLQSQEETLATVTTAASPEREMTLPEIMDEQVALNLHKKDLEGWKNVTADSLAKMLTKDKLFGAFPMIEKDALLEIWHAYEYDYKKTVEDLIASVGAENVNGSREAITEPPLSSTTLQEMKEAEKNCGDLEEPEEEKPAIFYREEANKHLKRREDLYVKARSYFHRSMPEVARFYSELAQKETKSYDKANHLAAAAFIEEHSKRLQKFDTLDLHFFYVKEAIPNLDIFIDRNINLLKGGIKRGQDLFVITGRGKNSEGGRSKIKPAVISRLKKRKIGYVQLNPGLLKIRVLRDSLITSDLP